MEKYKEAVADLETLVNKTQDGKQFTKDLSQCKQLLQQQLDKERIAAEELKKNKIQEVEEPTKGFKKVQIEEDSEDSDDKPTTAPKVTKPQSKTKSIDEATLKRAQEMALQEQTNATLKSIPKTAAGFVKDFSGLKRSGDKTVMLAYLKNIPVAQIEAFFKRTEVESDTLSSILDTLSSCLKTKEESLWACKFL